ncbi:MAG: hypothetical protein HOO91_09070 [Bacteroidales bacterium]|nr:hypothetical protein [Bacteroidales bacterium]
MKRLIIIKAMALLSVLLLIGSCSKDIQENNDQVSNNQQKIESSSYKFTPADPKGQLKTSGAIMGLLEINQVPWFSGGDADIYSRPGRYTKFYVEASNIRIVNDGFGVMLHIVYRVNEPVPNYTCLKSEFDFIIPVTQRVLAISPVSSLYFNGNIYDQYWGWTYFTTTTVAPELWVKVDGRGNDNTGNAQLEMTIYIPVTFE